MNYIVSDIHGEYGLFCRLMDKVGFSGGDRLFVLGDILGKGADELRLARLIFSMPEATVIAGNHEYDFIKHYRALVSGYGEEAAVERARDYFADGKLFSPELAAAFDSLPFYIETEDFVGVHAGLPLSRDGGVVPPGEARREQLVYDRRFKDPDVLPRGSKCVVFGHTPTRYVSDRDDILFYGAEGEKSGGGELSDYVKIHIDTGVYLSGVLGCLCADGCRAFYEGMC